MSSPSAASSAPSAPLSATGFTPVPGRRVRASAVAAVVVSHDGAGWLPGVIEGIKAQTAGLSQVIAIDTGSKDNSADLLEPLCDVVRRESGATGYPEAIRLALSELEAAAPEWIWLLHDDSRPEPDALDQLLTAAAEDPEADILGPKLREWPSLKRLLELGVTISGTGRRETGLELGEYDQGQHDEVRTVLAVNTAGMLVRRSVLLELGGFDDNLPVFGNDLDFGWRAAAAGHKTLIVPQAVVFHAEAAHRGVRRTPLTGRHTHYQARRAALYTLLVNSPGKRLPFLIVRLAVGTLLRMIGFLIVRSVGEALDDLAALVSLYRKPGEIRTARRRRRDQQTADPDSVRALLAPAWVPYRHGLDFVSDIAAAVTNQASDVAERRRAASAEHDPSSMAARRQSVEEEDEFADTGLVARFVTNPVALLLAVFVLVVLVAARTSWSDLVGGGLSPVPETASHWWGLYLHGWHPLGLGTDIPAPAYLLPLATVATFVGTSASVSLLLWLASPLALWGAWRLLRVIGRLVSPQGAPRWLLLWGSATYALLPATTGAWGSGRLGAIAAVTLLPFLAHAVLGFADPEPDRRWRAGWRCALLLALLTAFAPIAWVFCAVLGAVVFGAAFAIVRSSARSRSVWGPPAVAIGGVPILLAPWWLPALLNGAAPMLFLDIGRLPSAQPDRWALITGHLADGAGAPAWLGAVLALAAVLALIPRASRVPVVVCWLVVAVAALMALLLSYVDLDVLGGNATAGLAVLVVVIQGGLITAAVLGGQGVARALPAVGIGALVVAAVVPLVGLGWFVLDGETELSSTEDDGIPAYMIQQAETGPQHGILALAGNVDTGLTYRIIRGAGTTLGEDEILAHSAEDAAFTDTITTLTSRPTPEAIQELGANGIEYVVLLGPADGRVAAGLDATVGLAQASADDRTTRAWRVSRELPADAVDGPGSGLRTVLLLLQLGAVLVMAVLSLPTIRGRRT